MKIRIEETIYEGTGAEILDQLDRISLGEIDLSKVFGTLTQSMTINLDLWQLQNNFIRMTDQECHLPEAGLEKQAQVMFVALAKVGALEVLEDG